MRQLTTHRADHPIHADRMTGALVGFASGASPLRPAGHLGSCARRHRSRARNRRRSATGRLIGRSIPSSFWIPGVLGPALRLSTTRSLARRKANDYKAQNLRAKSPSSTGSENMGLERTKSAPPAACPTQRSGPQTRLYCGFRAALGGAERDLQIGIGRGRGPGGEPSPP